MKEKTEIKIIINKPSSFKYRLDSEEISSRGNDKEYLLEALGKAVLQDAEYLDHMVEITVNIERKEGECGRF